MLSFLKRKDTVAPAGAIDEAATVQAARTRARRRLIGAAVLVGVGIIGFPLLFETQPRPIAVDIPIEIPSREAVPPLSLPAPKATVAPRVAASAPTPRAAVAPVEPLPRTAEAPVEAAPPAAAPSAAGSAAVAASAPKRAASAVAAPSLPATATAAGRAAPPSDLQRDAQRAQALLDGKPVAATAPATAASAVKEARFVVQAGAYSDAAALREARQKVEKLGLKTYTQVIETDAGARTRVRVGPFATRDEAEKTAARIKGTGLAASILSL